MSWEAIQAELAGELGEPISIDALTGAWKIAQRGPVTGTPSTMC